MIITGKKIFYVLLIFLAFTIQGAFSISRFYSLEYGDYKCFKDGETCEYYIYSSGSGGHGKLCPESQNEEHPDVYFDKLADLLTSKYCSFTPTRIKKYECDYDFGHLTVYRKNRKIFSVSGTIPKNMDFQDTYNPNNCHEVAMVNSRSKNNTSISRNSIAPAQENASNHPDNSQKKNIKKTNAKKYSDNIKDTNTQKENIDEKFLPQKTEFMFRLIIIILVIIIIIMVSSRRDDDPYHKL